jgi:small subunit ribosomal protein S15
MAETDTINTLRLNPKDTGSSDVQIALLTQRINEISEHLKIHAKDHSTRRGLLMLVSRRRKLLDYLKRTAAPRYANILQALNLRK